MNADYVENIIRNIDKQSYKCILVDGTWGIGKSYMVRKALEDMKDRTCFISLFGMDDVQKIYHEAFFQLVLRKRPVSLFAYASMACISPVMTVKSCVSQRQEPLTQGFH